MNPAGFFFLCLYIVLLFFRPQEMFIWLQPLRLLLIVEVLLFAMWLSGQKRFDAPQYIDMFWLGVAIFLSYILVEVSSGIEALLDFFIYSYVIFICLANGLTTYDRARRILFLIILSTTFMSIDGLTQNFDPAHIGISGVESFPRKDGGEVVYQIRYLGFLNDPNDLGMMFVFALPVIAFLYSSTNNKVARFYYVFAFVLHLIALYLTNSRGSMLSAFVVLAVFLQIKYGGIRSLIIGGVFISFIMAYLPSRMGNMVDASSMGRIYAWHEGLQMFKWRPVFGIGQGRFLEYHPKTAHNSWVLALSELGLFGYYFWTSLVTSTLFYQFKMYRYLTLRIGLNKSKGDPDNKTYLNNERIMAYALMFSTLGSLTAAFFLSRTYMILMYLNAGLAVSQYHRLKGIDPGFSVHIGRFAMLIFVIFSILVIYLLIKYMSP